MAIVFNADFVVIKIQNPITRCDDERATLNNECSEAEQFIVLSSEPGGSYKCVMWDY